jgi:hypothetical protein
MQRRMPRIPRSPFQPININPGRNQPMPNFRIRLLRHGQQHAFAGKYRNHPILHQIVRGSYFLSSLKNRPQLRGRRQILANRRHVFRWPQPFPRPRLRIVAPLPVVELNPMVPALRADPADLLQVSLDVSLIFPVFRKPFPIVDVHSSQQVRDFHHPRRPALRQHRRQRFCPRKVPRQPMFNRALGCEFSRSGGFQANGFRMRRFRIALASRSFPFFSPEEFHSA